MNAVTSGEAGAADLLALSRLDDDGAPPAVPRRPKPATGGTEFMTRTDPAATGIIDALDSFYCYNITAALWADAVINRLEGLAISLLGDELAEIADRARAAARRLADRIGDLCGAITADPRRTSWPATSRRAPSTASSPGPRQPATPFWPASPQSTTLSCDFCRTRSWACGLPRQSPRG
jgi:hypothetical protein